VRNNLFVYPSEYAGANQATAASWAVGDDFDAIVNGLRAEGVTFEHYADLPDGDIHIMGATSSWSGSRTHGNILKVANMSP
jgi:hypothetical protein